MAIHLTRSPNTEQRIKDLLATRRDAEGQAQFIAETRRRVQEYEARYGIPSERIDDAIEAGDLVEDHDVGHWIFQYRLLCRVEEA